MTETIDIDAYHAKTKALNEKYQPRIVAWLNELADALKERGVPVTGVCDLSCEEYRYAFVVEYTEDWNSEDNINLDVTFEILESLQCDGTDEGVNFGINIVEYGGSIVGSVCFHNYTNEVWVDLNDEDAVEKRFLRLTADNSVFIGLGKVILDHAHEKGVITEEQASVMPAKK